MKKRYQIKRVDTRNTLMFWKYAVPFMLSGWVVIIGMIISMFKS